MSISSLPTGIDRDRAAHSNSKPLANKNTCKFWDQKRRKIKNIHHGPRIAMRLFSTVFHFAFRATALKENHEAAEAKTRIKRGDKAERQSSKGSKGRIMQGDKGGEKPARAAKPAIMKENKAGRQGRRSSESSHHEGKQGWETRP